MFRFNVVKPRTCPQSFCEPDARNRNSESHPPTSSHLQPTAIHQIDSRGLLRWSHPPCHVAIRPPVESLVSARHDASHIIGVEADPGILLRDAARTQAKAGGDNAHTVCSQHGRKCGFCGRRNSHGPSGDRLRVITSLHHHSFRARPLTARGRYCGGERTFLIIYLSRRLRRPESCGAAGLN